MLRNSKYFRAVVGATAVAALSFPLAACSDDSSNDNNNSNSNQSQAKPELVAEVSNLTGDGTQVTLDQGFVDALTSLKLTPGTVGDATLAEGAITFPITGGDVKYFKPGSVDPYVQGLVEHDGSGLSLTAGKTTVELTDFEVDPAKSQLFGDVSVNGKQAAERAPLFNLDGRTLKPLQTEGDIAILEGTKVSVSDDAAALLNDTFKTDGVKGGLLVGIAKISIDTQSGQ